ncbi:unnamed protein product [Callosobruchus maculatus]|uniref:Uncharacterized protein n=1 Tax=Callosobruchus maculatus TaxID=64391 RepID=A0A653DGM0_CALMS|nr:unnamed protein product [Callosobruchus maculatus]
MQFDTTSAKYEWSKKYPFLFKLRALQQNRYGSYESHPPAVVRLNQNYNAYNEYRPASEYSHQYNPEYIPEYNPPTMTRQQVIPYDNDPRGIWRHTSQIPTFRPREINSLKRRRSRSHLDDVFLPNHDGDECYKNGRQERNRYAYGRRNLHQITREDNRKSSSLEGAKMCYDKRQKLESKKPSKEAPVHNATKINEQATVNNKNNCKSSLPSEKVHKSGAEEQPTKKSDESAMISNDSTSSDLFKDIITTKSYLADRFSDTGSSCDFTENLSVVDMEISSQESTPKKMIIDQSCVDDHDKGTKELKNIYKKIDAMIMDKLKEPQNTSEANNIEASESSGDQIKNVVNIKGYKEPQNASERNNATKKSEEINKTVLSDIHSKNVAYMQKIEPERKTEGDNKVDMLYKRSESKESVSYRITPGYTIPKKIQAPQPSKQKAFSDINDVYSTDTRVLFEDLIGMSKSTGDITRRKNDMKGSLNSSDKTKPPNSRSHPDMLNTNSIHTNSNTSKPETSAVRLGMGPKVSNFRRSLDQSRSPIDYSSIEANVPNSKSYNCVPKKISFRRYSDRRRSVESSKSESNISPVSPFRSPVDASNLSDSSSKSSNCNRPESTLKSSNSDRNSDYNSRSPSTLVDSDNRSSKPESVDTSQNASRSENVQTKFGTTRPKDPPGNRSLFKSSNQIRPGGDGRTNSVPNGGHITPKSDCVENGFRRYYYTIQWDKCKAERSNVRPADDRNNQRKEAGGDKNIRLAGRPISLSGNARDVAYDSSSQDSSYSARSRENISSKHFAADLTSDETTDSSRDSGYKKSESISGNRSTSNNSKNMKPKQIVDRDRVPKTRPENTARLSLDSKLERSKMKRKMDNKTSTIARKKQRLDKRSSATSVPSDPRSHATSNMEKQNKSNNNDLELTSEKGICNTKAGLIVILEKASTKPTNSLGNTHSGSTSNNSSDDSTLNNLTTDLPSSSHTGVSHEHSKNVESDNICTIKEKIHNDLSDAASQKCDEHKSGHADKSEVPSQNLSYNDFDPVEEAVKSVVNGNRVSEDVIVALRKISASNNDDNKLKVTSNNLISDPDLDQESVITPIKEESDMLVNNIKKSVDGKSKDNSPEVTKIPLDIKSHIISTTSQDMYIKENLGNIEQIFDGKNSVLVSSSEVTVQIVESNLCHADVFSVSTCESLSIKMHEVSITSFEAGTCSPLPDFTFEPGKAKSSLIEPPDYDTVTILKPAEIIESAVYVYKIVEEQDIPIIDLIDDKPDSLDIPIIDLIDNKPDSHVIDLTEEVDVKKEEPVDDAADIYDLLKKAADSSEQITLYRSDETVNDSLDVQVTSVSISPPKSGSCGVKQESDGDDEVKKEMDEESEEPDSIFTEIELLNISRKTAKPEPVKMEVDEPASEEIIYIKDELDNNTPESASKEGTDSRGLGNVEKMSTEKEKEPQNADAQCEVSSFQNVSAINNVVLGDESSCSNENISGNDSAILPGTTPKISESTSQDDRSNQGCIANRNTAKDRHNEPIQEKVVKSKSVEAEIVDALHKIDEIIEKEENNRAINKISSQPSASITESSEEGTQQPAAQQPLSIPTSTPTTSVTILQNEVLNPPVVSQPTISPQTSFEASASYGTDNSIQRNNVVQDTRRDGSSETQSPSVIQTQDSLLQQDIWNISGILAKYLIRMHCLKACCDNYNKMLALYKLIDPTMYHNESNVMSELHERRLCTYATAMKASLQHYTFTLPPIPEDVLKVTFNRVKKLLPLPHLDIRWIIFVLFSLMKKQATYYYSHVSLKYLYIYLASASQQLNGPNRSVLVQQQLLQQQQHLAPDQLCALKNQIQQFNNICSTQQQLLNSKPQTTKTTTQRKRASKRSNISENPNPSTTNGKNQVQLRRSPPSYAESVSSRQQDPNNSTRVASAINPKTMAQLLQATPQVQSSSRVVSGTMTSPTHTMSVPNTSSAHFSTPVIRLKIHRH